LYLTTGAFRDTHSRQACSWRVQGKSWSTHLLKCSACRANRKTSVEKVFEETVQHCCFKSFRVGALSRAHALFTVLPEGLVAAATTECKQYPQQVCVVYNAVPIDILRTTVVTLRAVPYRANRNSIARLEGKGACRTEPP